MTKPTIAKIQNKNYAFRKLLKKFKGEIVGDDVIFPDATYKRYFEQAWKAHEDNALKRASGMILKPKSKNFHYHRKIK